MSGGQRDQTIFFRHYRYGKTKNIGVRTRIRTCVRHGSSPLHRLWNGLSREDVLPATSRGGQPAKAFGEVFMDERAVSEATKYGQLGERSKGSCYQKVQYSEKRS